MIHKLKNPGKLTKEDLPKKMIEDPVGIRPIGLNVVLDKMMQRILDDQKDDDRCWYFPRIMGNSANGRELWYYKRHEPYEQQAAFKFKEFSPEDLEELRNIAKRGKDYLPDYFKCLDGIAWFIKKYILTGLNL